MKGWRRKSTSAVHTITNARTPLSKDIDQRQRRYLISMGIRTACLLVAIFAPMPLPLRIVAIIGAVVLPYFAVVLANAGRGPEKDAEFSLNPPPDQKRRSAGENRGQIRP